MVKTLEGNRYALCEKLFLFPFCCSYQMHCYLAGCFNLIFCRHYLGIIISKIAGSSEGFTSGFLMLFYIGGPIIGGGAYLIFKWLPEKENEKIIEKQGESDFRMDSHRFRKRSTLPLRILFGLRDSKTFPALIFMI